MTFYRREGFLSFTRVFLENSRFVVEMVVGIGYNNINCVFDTFI